MNTKKCPISVLALSFVYAATGIVGFVKNLHAFGHPDFWWIEATEIIAVIAGVCMFLGKSWARWLALAWMAFHVALSLRELPVLAVHLAIFALTVGALLLPEARQYFRARQTG
jgi:uncharacterized protein YacL